MGRRSLNGTGGKKRRNQSDKTYESETFQLRLDQETKTILENYKDNKSAYVRHLIKTNQTKRPPAAQPVIAPPSKAWFSTIREKLQHAFENLFEALELKDKLFEGLKERVELANMLLEFIEADPLDKTLDNVLNDLKSIEKLLQNLQEVKVRRKKGT